MFIVTASTWEENVDKFQDVCAWAKANVSIPDDDRGIVDIEWSFSHRDPACKLFSSLVGRKYNDLVYGVQMKYFVD